MSILLKNHEIGSFGAIFGPFQAIFGSPQPESRPGKRQ
jgi:hypothetical protein